MHIKVISVYVNLLWLKAGLMTQISFAYAGIIKTETSDDLDCTGYRGNTQKKL